MYRTTKKVGWSKFLVFICFISTSTLISWVNGSNKNCWTNDAECLVQTILYKTEQESLPMEIHCENESKEGSSIVKQPPEYLLKRFERAFNIELNGCRKGFKFQTFGFEYLPNCNKIIEMKITHFHADALYELHCPVATYMPLENLSFEHNEIATITTEALSKLSLLKDLYFQLNSLRHIERGAFDNLHFIERIQIELEPLLAIKDATIFERTQVADLRLYGLKSLTSAVFKKLPQTLRAIYIEKTQISVGATAKAAVSNVAANQTIASINVNNPKFVHNISIIECALSGFHLNDDYGSVQFLNLSGNFLTEFEITRNNSKIETEKMELKILDLSNNKLNYLPLEWLKMCYHLEKLYLNRNYLKTIPLMPVLMNLPKVQNIDLRSNLLESLTETIPNNLHADTLYRVLIHIDNNPWNCKWLLSFAHTHPELFRIFNYEKFLSQINVNGLECMPEEPKDVVIKTLNITNIPDYSQHRHRYSSPKIDLERSKGARFTVINGNSNDYKRSQREGALIIVFMLPVGIAVLFVLLYLWIYCQKVFHISFYRKCSLCKKRKNANATTNLVSNRFDVVRQVPLNSSGLTTATTITTTINNNEGYELPLNGIPSICNCIHSNSNLTENNTNISNEKCEKLHHITYVPLPDEEAQKIYEEIIGGDDEDDDDNEIDKLKEEVLNVNEIYDHLTTA